MHSTMETTLWVRLSINANINYANIIEYVVKGGTEDGLLLNLAYKLNWSKVLYVKYPEAPIHAKTG